MLKFPGDTWLEAKKKVNNKEDQNSIWDMTAKQWRESRVIIARMNQRSQTVQGLEKIKNLLHFWNGGVLTRYNILKKSCFAIY